ncbi:MAG: hypothetical protein F6K59_37790 [Moorea sp. SIO3F7]|nr:MULTISPECIES: hypothetical protein [unclassified Moorena]NEO17724.1 hypothetical protein [Moorena sp. SIO3E8]NEQ04349.1 hypothetical protein [Moorena sp. SIO3F7]
MRFITRLVLSSFRSFYSNFITRFQCDYPGISGAIQVLEETLGQSTDTEENNTQPSEVVGAQVE